MIEISKASRLECENVGWLIYEDDSKVVLCSAIQTSNENELVLEATTSGNYQLLESKSGGSAFCIPKDWCIEIKEISECQ